MRQASCDEIIQAFSLVSLAGVKGHEISIRAIVQYRKEEEGLDMKATHFVLHTRTAVSMLYNLSKVLSTRKNDTNQSSDCLSGMQKPDLQ